MSTDLKELFHERLFGKLTNSALKHRQITFLADFAKFASVRHESQPESLHSSLSGPPSPQHQMNDERIAQHPISPGL
ncbi:hypothetical protein MnTg02_02299 [bacterium MnTg02]|nr:hypothetical protein MnTg02_02299 [bacterium MnTg02]